MEASNVVVGIVACFCLFGHLHLRSIAHRALPESPVV